MSGSTASSQNEEARDLDYEKDSLHIMPLHILPLKTPALLKARMVKNIQLDSMVELFKDDNSGSGQVEPSRLGRMFEWPVGEKHPDILQRQCSAWINSQSKVPCQPIPARQIPARR